MHLYWNMQITDLPNHWLKLMQLAADCCMIAEGVSISCGVSVTMMDNEAIRTINRETRNIDKATDVLSFPTVNYMPGKTAGTSLKRIRREYDSDLNACLLGDIVISIDQVVAQAAEYGHTQEREAAYLLTHGMCHLMGYDHIAEDERSIMRAMEEKVLDMIGLNREDKREPVSDQTLLALAKSAMERSYAPYSKFQVGACVLCADGRVFQGCNVENASFGLTNCAERTAIFTAISEGAREFTAIAIAAKNAAPWPCGACRQVLNEFAPDIRVLVTWDENKTGSATLKDLLPCSFGPKELPSEK